MQITIRPYEEEDYSAILEIYSQAAPPGIHPPEFIYKLDEPEAMPDAYFIAKNGSEYIGLSYIRPRNPDPNLVEPLIVQQCLTGVLPEYRRRGIATALKIKTINYAREYGYLRLFTNSENPAMQALNAKLGFQSGPWRVYLKSLLPD